MTLWRFRNCLRPQTESQEQSHYYFICKTQGNYFENSDVEAVKMCRWAFSKERWAYISQGLVNFLELCNR